MNVNDNLPWRDLGGGTWSWGTEFEDVTVGISTKRPVAASAVAPCSVRINKRMLHNELKSFMMEESYLDAPAFSQKSGENKGATQIGNAMLCK